MVLLPNDTVTLYSVLGTIMVPSVAGSCTSESGNYPIPLALCIGFNHGMFYKLGVNLGVDSELVSVAFESIMAYFSVLLSYNARIAPSKQLKNLLKIVFKIATT